MSTSKRRKFPKGLRMRVACELRRRRGTLIVRCHTAASGTAIMGLAGRKFFGLTNVTAPASAMRGGVIAVGTSFCAPVSRMSVPAKRVTGMRKAPVSFHAPRAINRHVGSTFRRLICNTKCSRYCILGGRRTNSLSLTTAYASPMDKHIVRICAARTNIRLCANG